MAEPPQLLVELEDNPDTYEYPLCLDRPSTLKECIAEALQEFSVEEDPRSYTLLVKRGDAYVRLSNAQYGRLPVDKDPRFRLHRDKHHASSPTSRTPSSTAHPHQAYTNGTRASQVPSPAFAPTASTSARTEEQEPLQNSPAPQHHHKQAQHESVGQEGQVPSSAGQRQEPEPQPTAASDAAPSRPQPEHSPSVELTGTHPMNGSLGARPRGPSLEAETFGVSPQAEVKPEPASPVREIRPPQAATAASQSAPASRQSSQAQPPASAEVSSLPAAVNGLSQSKRIATPPSAEQPPQKRLRATEPSAAANGQQTPQPQLPAPSQPQSQPQSQPSPAQQQPSNAAASGSSLQPQKALPWQTGQIQSTPRQSTAPTASQSSQASVSTGTNSQSSPQVDHQAAKTVVKDAQGQIFAVDNFKLDPLPPYIVQLIDALPEKLRLQAWMEVCFQRQKNKRMVQRDAWHAFRTHSMRPESPRFPRLTAPNYIGELKNYFTETSIYKVAKVDGSGEVFLVEHLTPRRPFPSPDDAAALISKVSKTP